MNRKKALAALTVTAAIASGALASGRGSGNDYQGRAEGDSTTYVGFDLVNRTTKLKNFGAVLNYHCPGQPDTLSVAGNSKGGLKVKEKGRFSGKLEGRLMSRGDSQKLSYKVTGKLGKHGKAKGTVDAVFFNEFTRGGRPVRCYSGGLDWKVRKGAHVIIEVRPDKGERK